MSIGSIRNGGEFKIVRLLAFAMLIGFPLIILIVAQFLNIESLDTAGESLLIVYILLFIAMVEPAFLPLIERFQVKTFKTNSQSQMSPDQLFRSVSIIKLAIVEAIYIYGLVVYVLTGDMIQMLWFYPIGAIWSAVYWPRRDRYEQFLKKV